MASVKIYSGLHGGEPADTVPKSDWPHLLQVRRGRCLAEFRGDCRSLLYFIEDGANNDWLGLGDREGYLRDGLGLDPDMVQWAIDGLKLLDGEVVGFDEAVVLGRHGGKREQGNNITLVDRGTAATYTLARLERDHKPLAAKVRSGELSAHAAAIEAGFRTKTIQIPLDPERAAATIIARGLPYARELHQALAERLEGSA